jgi:hypothetical protein
MKKQLFLRVSEIPSLIGTNPYANLRPLILRFWEKATPTNYYKTITNLVEKEVISNPLLRDEDIVKHHSKKYDLDLNSMLNTCKLSKTIKELQCNKTELIKHVEQQNQIADLDKQKLKESLTNLTRTNYGQYQENSAIDLYCKTVKMNVCDQQQFKKKKIATSSHYEWYITGKIDGIREDNVLVEIKNRVNRLFGTLRDYELVQIQIYLNMFKMKQGHLVECIKIGNKHDINIIDVPYDHQYWKNTIKQRLQFFIDFFYKFMNSNKLKYYFLTESDENINKYYQLNILEQHQLK